MLLLNTTASSLEKDHALEKKYNGHKPEERHALVQKQRPQALNLKNMLLLNTTASSQLSFQCYDIH